MSTIQSPQPGLVRFFTENTATAPLWLVIRVYVGSEWLVAAFEKITNPAWVGVSAGSALSAFVQGALAKTSGANPDVQAWYAFFLQHSVLTHLVLWSNTIAIGELLVGTGLILGLFTTTAAFFGFLMNINYLLAGTLSINALLVLLEVGMLFAGRLVGYYGLDGARFAFLARRTKSKL